MADQTMMSNDEKTRILDVLKNRGVSDQCSECKQGVYEVLGFTAIPIAQSATGDLVSGDPNAIAFICLHCGHIALHAKWHFGL